ncbi:hypothetical protein CSKR_112133 [Clonorchis sinensis]|uniref:Uncharacterized protein n=1 Tax=Clonorchis sinensis TaxID=79923 RepID=A0A3R7JLA0_CLOSI|nr:hypothetical protein CSKR_112133 [Clonorchis sinensis]
MWHEFIVRLRYHGYTLVGILSGRPHLDMRTIRVLNQSLWLKSLTARQRCLARNANALPFLRNKSPHVPTLNLGGQKTIDQPGMRDSVSVAGTPLQYISYFANTLICKQIWFCEGLSLNPAASLIYVFKKLNVLHQAASCFMNPAASLIYVFKKLNVLHQAASCFSWYDMCIRNALIIRGLRTPD